MQLSTKHELQLEQMQKRFEQEISVSVGTDGSLRAVRGTAARFRLGSRSHLAPTYKHRIPRRSHAPLSHTGASLEGN